ncbi:MAG: hypothetical protein M1839_006612 [Geoglossum umbratile]|nr:MAG: hypothetical protein M1839_006612 [Geoglossum umbratile]
MLHLMLHPQVRLSQKAALPPQKLEGKQHHTTLLSVEMVVFVDLEDLKDLGHPQAPSVGDAVARGPARSSLFPQHCLLAHKDKSPARPLEMEEEVSEGEEEEEEEEEAAAAAKETPNRGNFSAALASYPIISQIVRDLDLNDLHALALTCRQFRANLLPFRRRLVTQSLRCAVEVDGEARRKWRCARDLVAECRRCGKVVCRTLPRRHRRLCRNCLSVPLLQHARVPPTPPPPLTFTTPAFLRTPCTCPAAAWLCQPCGKPLLSEDLKHHDGWAWRERYSTCLGMMGIGEGVEGVRCGRGAGCTAAEITLVESVCDLPAVSVWKGWVVADVLGEQGYLVREIEGVAGLQKNLMKKELIGAVVMGDSPGEAAPGPGGLHERKEYLGREVRGEQRSWCGWCQRVIPGKNDDVVPF